MASSQSLPLHTPPFSSVHRFLPTTKRIFLPKIPLRTIGNSLPVLAYSAKPSISASEQDILQAVANSGDKSLPGVRTYENDLARLTLVGAVDFEQALTAAAADGGEAAAEHVDSGMDAMVVETVFPGPLDEHSTVSTRLFLPARKVKEKAKKLKSSLTEDILFSTTSKNILAMTFRQVVLQQLWNFELVLFRPGTERNMDDLENPREVPPSFTLSSSDERVISVLAEVVCLFALESTERLFLKKSSGRSNNLFNWFDKPKRIVSKDSSVSLYKLLEDEVVANARSLLENFNLEKADYNPVEAKWKHNWWITSVHSKLEKIGGPEFSAWTSEYIPAYRLQIDSNRLDNANVEGWKRCAENRWEVLLTHSQMVGLANVLDMYYEDLFTLPNKELLCGVEAKATNLSINKRSTSLFKMLSITLASGFFLVTVGVLGQLYLPHLFSGRKNPQDNHSLQSSVVECIHQSVDSTKLEDLCISVVQKIKDGFGWPGEIMTEPGGGAWTGEVPRYLRVDEADTSVADILYASAPSEKSDEEMKASAQDIASYQVVLSVDGKIIGFQPTSRGAVNNWSANPLAKELYSGRKLSPGFIEPRLNISHPREVVALELLMSVNPDSYFALARPVELSLPKTVGEN
ncbi:unnamed protein product [Ilex paraguariensis]|uniref:Deneddylase n=1 Tax=Ilex paraguariensis TaxID=185542 RepID=A0ABC8USK9_9AQUA